MVNNTEKIEPLSTQMEQWSILSNTLNYIQYDRYPKNYHSLGVSAVNKCGKNPCTKEEERDILELAFGQMPDILKEEYLDVYKGIQSEKLSITRFDENSDLSTTYLGKADRSKNNKIKMCCKSLHSLPKFTSKTQRIQVVNGQFVSVLFIIPVIVDMHGHRF